LSPVHLINFTPIVGNLVSFAIFANGSFFEKRLHFNPICMPITINKFGVKFYF
jgi:hypothetical protein